MIRTLSTERTLALTHELEASSSASLRRSHHAPDRRRCAVRCRPGLGTVFVSALVSTLLVGCTSTGSSGTSVGPTAEATATTQVGTTSATAASAEVVEFVEGLRDLTNEWNANQARWVAALVDDSVSLEQFVAVQSEVQADQGALLAKVRLWAGGLPQELEVAADPVLDHYEQRFSLLRDEVFPAAVGSDDVAFQDALANYQSLTRPAAVSDVLLEAFSAPVVRDRLAAEGTSPEELVATIVGVVGG